MAKIAVDVVLLPPKVITDKVIEFNRELGRRFVDNIVLNKEDCLPHISLAMGCLDEQDVGRVRRLLKTLVCSYPIDSIKVTGIHVGTNSVGQDVSSFAIEKTDALQQLHEQVLKQTDSYLSSDVSAEMVSGPIQAGESTLLWIRHYKTQSSFEHFFPHITLGYGRLEALSYEASFTPDRLALCHLGNHCTCREVLASTFFRDKTGRLRKINSLQRDTA